MSDDRVIGALPQRLPLKRSSKRSKSDQVASSRGARAGNENARKHGGYADPELDRRRAKSAKLNDAKRAKAKQRQKRRACEMRKWSAWKRDNNLDGDPATEQLIKTLVRSEIVCGDLENYLANRTPESAMEALRLFVQLLSRVTDDCSRLLKIVHGTRFAEADEMPLTRLIVGSMERENAATRDDLATAQTDILDDVSVDPEAVDGAEPGGGRAVDSLGAIPKSTAYPRQTCGADFQNTNDTSVNDKPEIESGPTHPTPVHPKRKSWRDNPNHPAIQWWNSQDVE